MEVRIAELTTLASGKDAAIADLQSRYYPRILT